MHHVYGHTETWSPIGFKIPSPKIMANLSIQYPNIIYKYDCTLDQSLILHVKYKNPKYHVCDRLFQKPPGLSSPIAGNIEYYAKYKFSLTE